LLVALPKLTIEDHSLHGVSNGPHEGISSDLVLSQDILSPPTEGLERKRAIGLIDQRDDGQRGILPPKLLDGGEGVRGLRIQSKHQGMDPEMLQLEQGSRHVGNLPDFEGAGGHGSELFQKMPTSGVIPGNQENPERAIRPINHVPPPYPCPQFCGS